MARWALLGVPVVPVALIGACGTVLDVTAPNIVEGDAAALEDAQREADGSIAVGDGSVGAVEADALLPIDAQVDAPALVDATVDAMVDAQVAEDAAIPVSCTGGTCFANAPTGWQGPFALYTGDPLSPVPTCSGALGNEVLRANTDLQVPPAGPSACSCTCGLVTNVSCQFATLLSTVSSSACSQTCPGISVSNDECLSFGVLKDCQNGIMNAGFALLSAPAVPIGGSCAATAGRSFPSFTWGTVALGCAPPNPAATCGSGGTCLPAPSPSFRAGACIVHDGDVSCPPATGTLAYTAKQRFYQGADDRRSCSTCSCGVPTGVSCTTKATHYSGALCTGTPDPSVTVGGCVSLNPNVLISAVPTGGQCSPSPVSPAGTVLPTMDLTVCCTP